MNKLDALYRYNTHKNVEWVSIEFEELAQFIKLVRELKIHLNTHGFPNPHTKRLLHLLFVLNKRFSSFPLPFSNRAYNFDGIIEQIKKYMNFSRRSLPSFDDSFHQIDKLIGAIQVSTVHPLIRYIQNNYSPDCHQIVISSPNIKSDVLSYFKNYIGNYSILGEREVDVATDSSIGIYFGPPRYFTCHPGLIQKYERVVCLVMNAPRAAIPGLPRLSGCSNPCQSEVKQEPVELSEDEVTMGFDGIGVDAFLRLGTRSDDPIHQLEQVECYVVILGEDKFIFTPCSPESKRYCIVDLHLQPKMKRIHPLEFDEDTAILLRRKKSDAQISEIADKLMGDSSIMARELQAKYKLELVNKIKCVGFQAICDYLGQRGYEINNQNLIYLLSESTIRPQDEMYFRSVLNYLGLHSISDDIIHNMNLLKRAHIKAGHLVSRELRLAVNSDQNCNEIKITMHKQYGPLAHGVGVLDAFKFRKLIDTPIFINRSEVGKVHDLHQVSDL
ncbi:hypothetical protein [Teredinibacter turnerae]|uniref:hypothetical protein n=1 Tax=Teredinibacter turnerae TaxID=2426 RepID=UPI00117D4D91|nr:hypothetical protein [Teredinibacter turnerae]